MLQIKCLETDDNKKSEIMEDGIYVMMDMEELAAPRRNRSVWKA